MHNILLIWGGHRGLGWDSFAGWDGESPKHPTLLNRRRAVAAIVSSLPLLSILLAAEMSGATALLERTSDKTVEVSGGAVIASQGDRRIAATQGVIRSSGASGCVGATPTGTRLPLVAGRFVVTLIYGTYAPGMPTGMGTAYRLSDNVGYFGTVDPMSADVIVKIVNFCDLNNTWSVYVGGTTDLQTSVSITDTMTGRVSQPFVNPLGHDFQLIKAQVFNCP